MKVNIDFKFEKKIISIFSFILLEIRQAIEDYQLCKNGFEHARHWQSVGIERSMVRH
jgi:hypothetical protein